MGIFGGGKGNQDKMGAQMARDAIKFMPKGFDLSGVGSFGVTPRGGNEGGFDINLTPEDRVKQLQSQLFGLSPEAIQASTSTIDPQRAAAVGALGGAEQAFGAFGSFDPLAAAGEQFSKIDELLAPGRARETAGNEARLLRQGRLDSTFGSQHMADRAAAVERERGLLASGQLEAAQRAQSNLAQTGLNLAQGGAGLGIGLQQQGLGAAQGAQQLSAPLLQMLGLGADLGQAETAANIAKSGAFENFNAGQRAMNAGGGIGGALGGALGGIAGSFAGPLGTALGSSLGGIFRGDAPAGSSAAQIQRNQR